MRSLRTLEAGIAEEGLTSKRPSEEKREWGGAVIGAGARGRLDGGLSVGVGKKEKKTQTDQPLFEILRAPS